MVEGNLLMRLLIAECKTEAAIASQLDSRDLPELFFTYFFVFRDVNGLTLNYTKK